MATNPEQDVSPMSPESPYLTSREFDRWATGHDARIERLVVALDKQLEMNIVNERRFTSLETNQDNAGKLSARLGAITGAVVAAVISGVFQLIGGAK
jgi:hypothetical protein